MTRQEPCEDYIKVPKDTLKYRESGIVAYNYEWLKEHFDTEKELICGKQNTGHWTQTGRIFMDSANQHAYEQVCSECKGLSYFRKSLGKLIGADYCPNCGAKMEGVKA